MAFAARTVWPPAKFKGVQNGETNCGGIFLAGPGQVMPNEDTPRKLREVLGLRERNMRLDGTKGSNGTSKLPLASYLASSLL